MFRPALFAFATLTACLAAPASASTFSASLASPASGQFITRDIVWNCGPAACQGATDYGQAVALCQSIAKRAGRVDSFLADGRALSAEQLARCNAAAKPAPESASANH